MITTEMRKITLSVAEIILFGLSLLFLFPPFPSTEVQQYHFVPGGIIAVLLFGLKNVLTVWRKGDNLVSAIIQVLLFLCFGMALYERVK